MKEVTVQIYSKPKRNVSVTCDNIDLTFAWEALHVPVVKNLSNIV